MRTKLIAVSLTLSLLAGSAPFALADTATSTATSLQQMIANLQAQIAELQAKLAALKAVQQQVLEEEADVEDAYAEIRRELREGISGDDVELIQILLSLDSSIYPHGLITGFYGRLTAQAIKNFQKKYGIQETGTIGPRTRGQLNKIFKEQRKQYPPQIRNALRKLCRRAPQYTTIDCTPFLKAKDRPAATTTPDSTAPSVPANLTAMAVSSSRIDLSWTASTDNTGVTGYRIHRCIGSSCSPVFPLAIATSTTYRNLGLSPSAAYTYAVSALDAKGNSSGQSNTATATTNAAADTTAPTISNIATAHRTATSTTLTWQTNEPATGRVWYATSTPVLIQPGTKKADSPSLLSSVNLLLSPLTASSTYHYLISATDAAGNTATSSTQSFATL